MKQEDESPRVTKGERDALPSHLIKVNEDTLLRLTAWIRDAIATIESKKRTALEQIKRTRKILASKNPDPPMRAGASHISVPLLMTEHSAVHASIKRNIFGHTPAVKIKLAGGVREIAGEDITGPLNRFSDFLDGQLRNTRALDGENTIADVAASMSSDGTGQWAVVITPPLNRRILGTDGEQHTILSEATVRWEPLRYEDIIFFDGYGVTFSQMPFCGYKLRKTWGDVKLWEASGYYYKDAVEGLREHYKRNPQDGDDRPPDQRVHEIAEIYLRYDIDGDNYLEEIKLDYHLEAERILRVTWNPFGQHRPVVGAPYDKPPKPRDYLGSGIGVKLEGSQTEASMIHNLGIESGKRGIANILVLRENSGIDEELGGDEVVVPGDTYATETPNEDVKSVPLGDPTAVQAALMLEGVTQGYAQRVTGRDDGAQGQLSAGKRVSPKVGVPILREGRTARENATGALAAAMMEAIYLTITAWQFQRPARAFDNVLSTTDIAVIESLVFTPQTDIDIRDRVVVNVIARDVAGTEEQKRQAIMLLNQFLMQWYNSVLQMLQQVIGAYMNPQTAAFGPAMQAIHLQIVEKLANGVKVMLQATDDVEDPEELLIEMADIKAALDEAASTAGQVGSGPPNATPTGVIIPGNGGGDLESDLGAGVT